MSTTIPLEQVRIASPCPVPWAEMGGTDRVRFCRNCQLHVFNLSTMTRAEAEQLINETEGRLCVSYYQRADGTVLTRDCPVGRRMARAAARWMSLAAAFCLFVLNAALSIGGAASGRPLGSLHDAEPFQSIRAWFAPVRMAGTIRGRVALPRGCPSTRSQHILPGSRATLPDTPKT